MDRRSPPKQLVARSHTMLCIQARYEAAADPYELEPHTYGIAKDVVDSIVGRPSQKSAKEAILISGESGSGKTEACKIALAYFAEVCKPKVSVFRGGLQAEGKRRDRESCRYGEGRISRKYASRR